MIDPNNIPERMTPYQRQEFALFALAVSGHAARATASALERFLFGIRAHLVLNHHYEVYDEAFPFEMIEYLTVNEIAVLMRIAGIGCYTQKSRAFYELVWSGIDLRTCTLANLLDCYGFGNKTARFFLTYSREEDRDKYAILDVHVLNWMRANKVGKNPPTQTPSSNARYRQLESDFLQAARARQLSARELDEQIWKEYAR